MVESTVAAVTEVRTAVRAFDVAAIVGGRYEVVRFISSGGMGDVYEVTDRQLGERVALKTLRSELGASAPDSRIDRFRREVTLARRITHESVCRVFDLGVHEVRDRPAIPFLTMELLAGESLAERIARGPVPIAEARCLVRQMLAGLAAAHRAGVMHRDFKPRNVMLVAERVVVTDFGLARVAQGGDDVATTGLTGDEIVGTPAHMAPEQVEGGALTAATDVYALGVVMYELATGSRPFEGPTPLATAAQRPATAHRRASTRPGRPRRCAASRATRPSCGQRS